MKFDWRSLPKPVHAFIVWKALLWAGVMGLSLPFVTQPGLAQNSEPTRKVLQDKLKELKANLARIEKENKKIRTELVKEQAKNKKLIQERVLVSGHVQEPVLRLSIDIPNPSAIRESPFFRSLINSDISAPQGQKCFERLFSSQTPQKKDWLPKQLSPVQNVFENIFEGMKIERGRYMARICPTMIGSSNENSYLQKALGPWDHNLRGFGIVVEISLSHKK